MVISGGTTTTYAAANSLNQYPSVGGLGATYDGNGNLKTYDGWTYTYDAMNRLTSASDGTTTASFWYDGLNRQVARSITGTSTRINFWDGWNLYSAYASASATSAERFVYGTGGELLQSRLPSIYYFYPDALGSTSHLADSAGGLKECYTYDLYGNPTFYDTNGNARVPNATAYGITHLFTGQRWYPQISLYDNRNRFLKPDWGRFLQPDPIGFAGDPANLYRYCANNPVNLTDPYGLINWGKVAWGGTILTVSTVGAFGLVGADVLSAGALTPVLLPVGAFLAGGGFTVGAAYFAEGLADSPANPLDGAKNVPSDAAVALARIAGPKAEKAVKMTEAGAGIALAGLHSYDAVTYVQTLGNAADIGTSVVELGSEIIETDRGRSSSTIENGQIVVTGTSPQYARLSYWATIFPGSLLGSFAPSSQYAGWYQGRTYNPVTGGWDRHSSVSHDTSVGFDGNLLSPMYQAQARNP